MRKGEVIVQGIGTMKKNEMVLFEAADGAVALPVQVQAETVWLTQAQMAVLFEKDRSVIGCEIAPRNGRWAKHS